MNLPAYRPGLGFTYAFGRFAVAEALTHRPHDTVAVRWHGDLPAVHVDQLVAAARSAGVSAQRDDAAVTRLRRKPNVHCVAQVRTHSERLDASRDHAVMLRPSHPGNVGTAIRSLVAFGFHDLALVQPSVNHWGPYVVRSSVGIRFALRCQEFASVNDYLSGFGSAGAAGGRTLYLFDAAGKVSLDQVRFRSPFSLVFGPEWQEEPAGGPLDAAEGLAAESVTVRIPQSGLVESLNLATTVSIAAYRARRRAPL